MIYDGIIDIFKKTLYNSPLKRPMYHHPSLHWSLARHGVTKIGVTSSNNETSPAIVTHNRSDKSVVCADPVREKIGPSLRLLYRLKISHQSFYFKQMAGALVVLP